MSATIQSTWSQLMSLIGTEIILVLGITSTGGWLTVGDIPVAAILFKTTLP